MFSLIDYNFLSRFSGSGTDNLGNILELASISGTTSPAYSLGVQSDGQFWNPPTWDAYTNSHFLVTFNKFEAAPTGDITLYITANNSSVTDPPTAIGELSLWYLKEVNPALSADYLIATGLAPAEIPFGLTSTAFNLYSRGYINYDAYPSLSGKYYYGPVTFSDTEIDYMDIQAESGVPDTSIIFNNTIINETLSTITYKPNTELTTHKWSGAGLAVTGPFLENLSSNNLVDFVKHGSDSAGPKNDYYWTNEVNLSSFVYSWFNITFNKTTIYPDYSGEILFNIRAAQNEFINNPNLENISIWAKKENNPSLTTDVLIGSGQNTTITYSVNLLEYQQYSTRIPIIEANRGQWQSLIPDLYLTASGQLAFDYTPNSGTHMFNGMDITVSGDNTPIAVPTELANNFDLFIHGQAATSSGINLYTFNSIPANSGFDMYTFNSVPVTNGMDMYTVAGMINEDIDLYIIGHIPYSGQFNLYTFNSVNYSGNFDLTITGDLPNSGSFNLYLDGPSYIPFSGGPQMVLTGPSNLPYSGILPMVVFQNTNPNLSFDLFIQNSALAANSGFRMFLQAPSGTLGAVPWSGVLPMYIGRTSEGIDAGINMYIGGPTQLYSGIDMIVNGTNMFNQSFNLSISGGGPINQAINLFNHGI